MSFKKRFINGLTTALLIVSVLAAIGLLQGHDPIGTIIEMLLISIPAWLMLTSTISLILGVGFKPFHSHKPITDNSVIE